MAIRISAKLKSALAKELDVPKDEVEDYIWNHKSHDCFLCGDELNRAGAEAIELDHNVPSSDGGEDIFKNLNFAHASCNKSKSNNPTVEVRPHLKFKRFYDKSGGAVNFRNALKFFDIKETDTFVKVSEDGQTVAFELPTGPVTENVFSEIVRGKPQRFCFVSLPISAVTNDDDIQPRQIKLNHVLSIAADMQKNPLHEQPACRLQNAGDKKRILMFDGQHKTVAKLINGATDLVFKVYLDLSKDEAVLLVNSIQSRIKKLPLTPFELATKMADEVRRQLETYEEVAGTEMSEAGFIAWLDKADQSRAKAGIASAVIDSIVTEQDMAFGDIVLRHGNVIDGPIKIREAAFQNSMIKQLAHHQPLPSSFTGEAMKQARERERRQIIRLLSIMYEEGFQPFDDEDEKQSTERIKRLTFQSSLKYVANLMKNVVRHCTFSDDEDRTFLEKDISEEQWEKISNAASRLFLHPIWTVDLNSSEKTADVAQALSKNQGFESAFRSVRLDLGYCLGEKLPTHWA